MAQIFREIDWLLLKFVRIGLLTNRLGRNEIPYHSGNHSYHSWPSATRVRIISLVVRNFIPTRAIGQESYIPYRSGKRYNTTLHLNGSDHGLTLELGAYVAKIQPGSVAAKEGSIAVGDRIVCVSILRI